MPQLKFVCWNVNGIRAMLKKDFLKDIKSMNADVLCFQETKASVEDVKDVIQLIPGYHGYANSSKTRKGYSGTAILSKEEPLNVTYDLGFEDHDMEGRVITAEFLTYFLVTVYTPNSGDGLRRLDYRETWDIAFRDHVVSLRKRKPVIVCGDLNVAHQEIDIANPKENYNKSAGYTQREIDGFQRLLDEGFVDTFRHLNPTEAKYTYWSNFSNSRARNIGWRIDYYLVPQTMISKVKKAEIYNEYMGSDHCPIALSVEIP